MTVEEELKGVLARVIGINDEEIVPEASLKGDLGVDSTEMVDFLVEIEKVFGLRASKDILNHVKTFGELVNYIEQRKAEPKAQAAIAG